MCRFSHFVVCSSGMAAVGLPAHRLRPVGTDPAETPPPARTRITPEHGMSLGLARALCVLRGESLTTGGWPAPRLGWCRPAGCGVLPTLPHADCARLAS